MPARTDRFGDIRPRERVPALIAAGLVNAVLALALLSGLRVSVSRARAVVERLVDVQLQQPPPPPLRSSPVPAKAEPRRAAPPPRASRPGGSPGPAPSGAPTASAVVTAAPARPAGGGVGPGA